VAVPRVRAQQPQGLGAALHYGGLLIYLVLVGWAYYAAGWQGLVVLLVEAALARALLFDPSLNLSQSWVNHREGRPAEPLFKVGTIAFLDLRVRWLAAKLSMQPEHLRAWVWVVCLLVAAVLLVFYR
jgi:hypothetical protein